MNTYILVLTLVVKSGYAGMGGMSTLEVKGADNCQRIGEEWKKDIVSKMAGVSYADKKIIFTCIKKY
jgi:hypothetical protein